MLLLGIQTVKQLPVLTVCKQLLQHNIYSASAGNAEAVKPLPNLTVCKLHLLCSASGQVPVFRSFECRHDDLLALHKAFCCSHC